MVISSQQGKIQIEKFNSYLEKASSLYNFQRSELKNKYGMKLTKILIFQNRK